jgi:gliotoxin/aspirochlorine biosynthesis aminotransferase
LTNLLFRVSGGFDWLVKVTAGVQPVYAPVAGLDEVFSTQSILASLEKAFSESPHPIKALVLSNPNNPLGQCYSAEVLKSIVKFCDEKKIHFISDEIYAMSQFASPDIPTPTPFVSALQIDLKDIGCDPSRVHVIWGLSKDLGSNGLRLVNSLISSLFSLQTSFT